MKFTEQTKLNVVLSDTAEAERRSLVEAMLYVSGVTNRMGKVTESNTVSDFGKRNVVFDQPDLVSIRMGKANQHS